MPAVPMMGWQGLTSSLLMLVMLVMASHLEAAGFPQELACCDITNQYNVWRYPAFRGNSSAGLHIQLMKKIQETLFIGGREQVYLVSLRESYQDQIVPYKMLTWPPSQPDIESCDIMPVIKAGGKCHNFIKVLAPINNELVLICGTHAIKPKCRYFRLDNLDFDGELILEGLRSSPLDPEHLGVALFADGYLYSAAETHIQLHKPLISRRMGTGPVLFTADKSDWLKEPHFLHVVEFGDYVYFFFREITIEHDNMGNAFYSRVARVCKNETGDKLDQTSTWKSFIKARLNCSVPGDTFFHFDVLQAITNVVDINGVPSVVGIFRTQTNSIPGSAVCAFSMSDIDEVLSGSSFPDGKLKPGSCVGPVSTKFYLLLNESVPSIGNKPWFTKTQFCMERTKKNERGMLRYNLTAIAVDHITGRHKNDTVVFVGTETGIVLKVLVSLNDSVLLEEMDVFNPDNTEDNRKIISFHLEKDTHTLYVGFNSSVVRIPLSHCERHRHCQKCIKSRDPYCIWTSDGGCERINTTMRTENEQDVEKVCHGPDVNKSPFDVLVYLAIFVLVVYVVFFMVESYLFYKTLVLLKTASADYLLRRPSADSQNSGNLVIEAENEVDET